MTEQAQQAEQAQQTQHKTFDASGDTVLIAYDGSAEARGAVEHAGRFLSGEERLHPDRLGAYPPPGSTGSGHERHDAARLVQRDRRASRG